MTEPIIQAEHLAKRFTIRKRRSGIIGALRGVAGADGSVVAAVDDVSLSINQGEMIGYIGPNGAGKSTTIKMLTGILVPSSGTSRVAGLVPWESRKQLAQKIGVVFGQRTQLWWDLPLRESLNLLQHLYRVPSDRFRQNLTEARKLLDLDEFLDTPVRQLSLGQRMRGDLTAALLHDPQVLYLDEPTIGLDVVAKTRIREFLDELNRQRGVTVLLTTHDLADIEQLCKRVIIIDHGRVLFDDQLEQLRMRHGTERRMTVDFELAPDTVPELLAGNRVKILSQEGARVTVAFDRTQLTAAAVLDAVSSIAPVQDMSIQETSIESIIAGLYQNGRMAS